MAWTLGCGPGKSRPPSLSRSLVCRWGYGCGQAAEILAANIGITAKNGQWTSSRLAAGTAPIQPLRHPGRARQRAAARRDFCVCPMTTRRRCALTRKHWACKRRCPCTRRRANATMSTARSSVPLVNLDWLKALRSPRSGRQLTRNEDS